MLFYKTDRNGPHIKCNIMTYNKIEKLKDDLFIA